MIRTSRQFPPPVSTSRPQLDPHLERLAHLMDSMFHIPGVGIRFGIDALLGLVPGLGDTFSSLASIYILHAATRYGVSRTLLLQMAGNIAIDYLVGIIPILGDLFDVVWKANRRNVELLREHLEASPQEERKAAWGDRLFLIGLVVLLFLLLVGSVTTAWWLVSWLIRH